MPVFLLGAYVVKGQLGERTYSKAIRLYKQAANNEYGLAMLRLGMIYEKWLYDIEINLDKKHEVYQPGWRPRL